MDRHHVDLLPGQELRPQPDNVPHPPQENLLFTPTFAFMLIMQSDGNLVYYALDDHTLDGTWSQIGNPAFYTEVVWASGTSGRAVERCIMQDDGNLVIYAPDGSVVWASYTENNEGAYLRPQDDGNLVIYVGDTAIWESGTKAGGG